MYLRPSLIQIAQLAMACGINNQSNSHGTAFDSSLDHMSVTFYNKGISAITD
jgi:hypothetical protein